jgi:hypothetical protein
VKWLKIFSDKSFPDFSTQLGQKLLQRHPLGDQSEGGLFAIVDGQHRTTAAILRGHEKVPCQVVQADRAKQAAAYANITRTTAQQLYHAKLAEKDAHALTLADVCAAADVEILRKNLIRSDIKKDKPAPSRP